jgi:DNA-binding transcriptional LysR family regulator
MDRLIGMRTFALVVDSGSFAAAAKRLAVSPATVTHNVQLLEDYFGVRLLNRTTRKLSLTEVGQQYYDYCARILADIEEAERFVASSQATPRGLLRLNTSVWLANVVAPLIPEFSASFPNVSFEVIMTHQMVDMVERGFDLAVRAGPLPDSSLICRRIGIVPLTLCAAPDYLARRGTPERPADLISHNCLTFTNISQRWRLAGAEGEIEIDVTGNLRSNNFEVLRRATLAGHGISLLPVAGLITELKEGRLVPLLPNYRTDDPIVHAIYPASRYLSTAVRAFLDFLVNRLSRHPILAAAAAHEPINACSISSGDPSWSAPMR